MTIKPLSDLAACVMRGGSCDGVRLALRSDTKRVNFPNVEPPVYYERTDEVEMDGSVECRVFHLGGAL